MIVTCQVDKLLFNKLSDQFSDHKFYASTLLPTTACESTKLKDHRYAFQRTNWDGLNGWIERQSVATYYFSSVNELIRQWYEWLWEEIDMFVPRVTCRRKKLQPWISESRLHFMRKLPTMKHKQRQDLARLLKMRKLEKTILEASDANLVEFETIAFEEGTFSKMQKCMKSIRKGPAIPPTLRKGAAYSANRNERFKFFLTNLSVYSLKAQRILRSLEPGSPIRYTIDHNQVSDIMKELNVSKSTGHEKIGNLVLKMCHHTLTLSLTFIFKTCPNKRQYPNAWNTSQVTPMLMEGKIAHVSCYRPITLLCCCSKVFEKVIFDALYRKNRDRLVDSQYGFPNRRSATIPLLLFLNRISELYDKSETDRLAVICLDFAKAFDTVL